MERLGSEPPWPNAASVSIFVWEGTRRLKKIKKMSCRVTAVWAEAPADDLQTTSIPFRSWRWRQIFLRSGTSPDFTAVVIPQCNSLRCRRSEALRSYHKTHTTGCGVHTSVGLHNGRRQCPLATLQRLMSLFVSCHSRHAGLIAFAWASA
jgi:hypothetical protein